MQTHTLADRPDQLNKLRHAPGLAPDRKFCAWKHGDENKRKEDVSPPVRGVACG